MKISEYAPLLAAQQVNQWGGAGHSAIVESIIQKVKPSKAVEKAIVEAFEGPAYDAYTERQTSYIENLLEAANRTPSAVIKKTLVEAVRMPHTNRYAQAFESYATALNASTNYVDGKAQLESIEGIDPLALKAFARKAKMEASVNVPTDQDVTEATGLLSDYKDKATEAQTAKNAAVAKTMSTVAGSDATPEQIEDTVTGAEDEAQTV